MKGNRIPRTFNRITGKMLIATNLNQPGDILHVYKNNFVIWLNLRTGKHAYYFVSMLRNPELFRTEEII
jgi:hypothetical protein